MKKVGKSVIVVDPINGQRIAVRSIYRPGKTLLQGAEYSRNNTVLKPSAQFKRGPWRG